MNDQPRRLRDILADEPLLLTPEEAAIVLRVGRTTVYALMKSGTLHAIHIGRSCRISRAELERYVNRLDTPHRLSVPVHSDDGRPRPASGRCSTTRAVPSCRRLLKTAAASA